MTLQDGLQRQSVLDYDDLLLYWAQMMTDPGLAAHIGERFGHVLVDEYQDTNRLQSSILLAPKAGGDGLTVVGDDAQSIYAFRAATVRNILDFPESSSARRPRSSRWIATTAPLSRPSPPPMASSAWLPSASPRTCGPSASRRNCRHWSACATRSIRPVTWSSKCWRTGRAAQI